MNICIYLHIAYIPVVQEGQYICSWILVLAEKGDRKNARPLSTMYKPKNNHPQDYHK